MDGFTLDQLQDAEEEEQEFKYDYIDYFFDNFDKVTNKEYRKEDKEFHQIFTFLRSQYYWEFHNLISNIEEFCSEIVKLYEDIDRYKYGYLATLQGTRFINKIREDIRRKILKITLEPKIYTELDLYKVRFFKDLIKSENEINYAFGIMYPIHEEDIAYEEYTDLGKDKYNDFIFPYLIYDEELYDLFCIKYLFNKTSDFKKFTISESYDKDMESYNQKLKEIKESTI